MSDTIKPVAWMCPVDEGDGPDISCNWEYASLFKGKAEPLYTAAALDAARDAALEEAARMCEHNASLYPYLGTGWESSIECAAAIRALKEKP